MLFGFSFLFFLLSIATWITAIPRFLRMRKINQNSAATTGLAILVDSPVGILVSPLTGKVNRFQILYRTTDDKEHMIEVIDANVFKIYRYTSGDPVEIVYDKNAPWQAYVQQDWSNTIRDLWLAAGELLASVILLATGLKIPA